MALNFFKRLILSAGSVSAILLAGYSQVLADESVTIPNPTTASNFKGLVDSVASAVLTIALPLAVAVLVFIGFKFVVASAQGNEKNLTAAKSMFWWALIGTAILVGASVLAKAVVNFAETLH